MMASVRMNATRAADHRSHRRGARNKEIAQRLNIATYTVKSHVHTSWRSSRLHSRLQIAAHAHKKTPPKGDRRQVRPLTHRQWEKSTLGASAAAGVCSSKYARGFLPSTLAVSTCGKRRM